MKHLFVCCLVLLCVGNAPAVALASEHPNIILVITDDQRWDTLWAMPELQAIAARGTTFTNAFANTPLCCPARVSVFKGMTPAEAGVLRNSPPRGGWASADMSESIFTLLHDHGYWVGHFGKMLNGTPEGWIAPGVDVDCTFRGNGGYYGADFFCDGVYIDNPASVYSTTFIFDRAREFINSTPEGQPYFLLINPRAAHNPFQYESQYSTAFSNYSYVSPSINEDVSDKCWHLQGLPAKSNWTGATRNQLRTLLSVDRELGELAATLDWNNTVFIYTSDQGLFNADHRLGDKGAPYEQAIRVPLVIAIPGGAANIINPALVVLPDLHLFIQDIAGLPILSGWKDAPRSLRTPLTDGFGGGHENIMLMQFDQLDTERKPGFIGVRDARYKLVEFSYGCREFYDLAVDPYELTNQITNPEYAEQINAMLPLLDDLREQMLSLGWSDEWSWAGRAPQQSKRQGGR